MEVILIDDVYQLGRRGQVVSVHEGYGRNYLIPRKLAIPATPGNLLTIEQQRAAMAKKESRHRDDAELLANDLRQKHILISRKAGDTGVLFGSVTASDIASALETDGIQLDRRKILLGQPIKAIGTVKVDARPHPDVDAELLISVVPEAAEAVSKVIPRGLESDEIIEGLEAKIGETRRAVEAEAEAAAAMAEQERQRAREEAEEAGDEDEAEEDE